MAKRGRLRVLLGAAPGVGKTFAMLHEGTRMREAGKDVVVAVVETHGRAATAEAAAGLEVVGRATYLHRGVELTEMDLDAVIGRRAEVALVDELAHTNAPGARNLKRWEDVEELLDAGIDVVSTVNIQHIESLNDVVEQITGVPQRETIPDDVLRRADQVEVVDLSPQALRDRLAGGLVYPAERIDAALSNYFRLGNLTALRELALLWLADDVDQSLKRYRDDHGIDATWEARERVVVALTGGAEGETLLRRGARIAARSGSGELLALHVTSQDGLRVGDPGHLARQRALAEQLGGTYHQVVGEDVPAALIEFARSVNATQLVIGVSRRNRVAALLTGASVGSAVTRDAGTIDVHIVNHADAGGRLRLPRLGGALTPRRRIAGFVLALVAGPLLTWLLASLGSVDSFTTHALSYQVLVVAVALVGGLWPALFAAVLSGVTLDFFFVAPFGTVLITDPSHVTAIVLYLVIAALVSFVVDRAARRAREARRAAAESQLLQTVAGSVLRGQNAMQALVERTREAFGLAGVRLVDARGVDARGDETEPRVLASCGEPVRGDRHTSIPVAPPSSGGSGVALELHGRELDASERRLLTVIVAQLGAAVEHRELREAADEVAPLAASDKVRRALLSALSHDLRRPLASATAAVTGLRVAGDELDDHDRDELLETADESLGTLATLVTDLLDVSRLQSGALAVSVMSIDPADAILPSLDELGLGPADVELALDPAVASVAADPALLQRVLVNLLANAVRHSPPSRTVRLATSQFGGDVQIRVVDHGPGIPAERRGEVFEPFQRLGDTDNTTGLGLGLAISKGFVEGMQGTLVPEDTPGGGVTMVVTLPIDAAATAGRQTGEGRRA
ncbi:MULTISPECIES: sensor histidine kinase [unclassified Pseudoclavibacter]|uniref:sensor histidine kinase n=1 Tax=unclassified Pseudoclavibacter TaxID=2615177 RepID=UPI001BACB0C8|nr:ATP-binding protein [Pseudoclavibacter sp. Marseille-Q4354]MBS3180307.1 sensor histidine kinase KdpD [Pseudoclavibacter sp. Marseille-Q4354]